MKKNTKTVRKVAWAAVICGLATMGIAGSWNRVISVIDGDTVVLANIQRVRLLGLDAPEMDRCGGKESRDYLKKMLLGKKVILGEVRADGFSRVLGLVFLKDKLVNRELIASGWARWDGNKNSQSEILQQASDLAREKRLGIYSDLCQPRETEKEGCLIKGNIDKISGEKRYHFPGCREYDRTVVEKDRGEKWFCSEAEAEKEGFVKAAGCFGKTFDGGR